jgi:cytochrome c553
VVQTASAPPSHVVSGGGRYFDSGAHKPVPVPPTQIFEVAENDGVKLRDPHVGFVAFVPQGSLGKGRVVALGSRGKMKACSSCHGDGLKGHEDVPPLAGRSPTYMVRQMSDMAIGARKGPALGKMQEIIGKLSAQDMVNVAAYAASLKP